MLSQGVNNEELEDALTNAVHQDRYSTFFTDLVTQSDHVKLFDLLISTAIKEQKWTLVEVLLAARVKEADRQQECMQAIASCQWGLAFGMLIGGVSLCTSDLDKIFKESKGLSLSEHLCKSSGNAELAVQLMERGVAHGDKETVIYLMEHHRLSDNQVGQVLKAAADLEDRTLLCDVLKASSKSRRVFRDNCPHALNKWWENVPLECWMDVDHSEAEKFSDLLVDLCQQNHVRLAVSATLSLNEHVFCASLRYELPDCITNNSQTCLSLRDKVMRLFFRRINDISDSISVNTAIQSYGRALLAKTQGEGAGNNNFPDEVKLFILELLRLGDFERVVCFVCDKDRLSYPQKGK